MSTFQEKLNKKVAAAQIARAAHNQAAQDMLLGNDGYIEVQRSIAAKSEEIVKLNMMLTAVSMITPFSANDGRTFKINAFPVSAFGPGMDTVIGMIIASSGAFTEEMKAEFTAITKIPMLEFAEAATALGATAYCDKLGTVVPEIKGDFTRFSNILKSICVKLNLAELSADSITAERVDLWMAKATAKAKTEKEEYAKNMELEATTQKFTLEDY